MRVVCSRVHECKAGCAQHVFMHACMENTNDVCTRQTRRRALQASCSLPCVCACVKPRISLSCIHVCMHEEPEMRLNMCVRRVLMWNQGAKPNVCVCHVFMCACIMCVSCAHVCMHEEPEMRTKVCMRGVFKCTSRQCVYA
jgi:hypothetical protein